MSKDPFAQFNLPPQEPTFGTPAHRMARSTDISTSLEAAKSIDATKLEQEVYECIRSFGERGTTAQEIKETMDRLNCWQRVAPLLEKGFIFDTGERRVCSTGRRQRVVVAKDFINEVEVTVIEKKQKKCPHCGGGL
jgi:hypothetical protein